MVLPFTSSDVIYYLGIGRLDGKYQQNPYYVTIREFVDESDNIEELKQDTVLMNGYINDWGGTTVVYGALWTFICRIIANLSFGNIDIALFIFKLFSAIVHIINCYLIYKVTNKKMIFVLLYGLNPYILIEAIACGHNDIYMILFMLLSLYYVLKKKNLIASIIFLAMATAIKYFSILLLPFIIIYHFRDKKPLKRLMLCIGYGMMFLLFFAIPYLLYIKDFQVLAGLITQQEKFAKSFYIVIMQYFTDISVDTVKQTLLICFAIIYICVCVIMLFDKKITFRKQMQKSNCFIAVFLFALITNFQPWYIMWLFPCMMWQKSNNVRLIVQISIISQIANSVFLINGEGWQNATPFIIVMLIGSVVAMHYNCNKKYKTIY